jgi:hypothetical protein
MSKSAQLFLITALIYLVLSLALHVVVMFDVWLGFNPLAYTSVGSTLQTTLIGWLTQSVMAIVYDRLLRSPRLATIAWACLNVGLVLTIIGQPVLALTGHDLVGGLVAMGGLMQAAGGIAFAIEVARAIRAQRNKA